MADMSHSELIAEFIDCTGASAEIAEQYLSACEWSVVPALQHYYEATENDPEPNMPEPTDSDLEAPAPIAQPSSTGGGRRLGGEGDPIPTTGSSTTSRPAPATSSNRKPPQQQKKFGTIRDIQGGGNGNGDDDDDSDKEQEFYAGGDKSGLAVQDPSQQGQAPSDQIRRLMNTARRGAPRPGRADGVEDAPPRPSFFGGTGQTLGGDDVESRTIPSPESAAGSRPVTEMVERTLHLWEDGFSIDDGPLYRFDDPANRRTLDMINSGSAPMNLMNVQSGQAVDVKLDQHHGEKYKQPKKKYKPFEGGGQRLGSPTPGVSTRTAAPPTPAAASAVAPSAPTMDVDESQPTLSLRVQMADGTRLPSRFNTTHTIGDVYDFVERSMSGGQTRAYVLATTFPTKELTDKAQVLGNMAEFKRGGVVVQKWV